MRSYREQMAGSFRSRRGNTRQTMQLSGKRVKLFKWIHGACCVVRVRVEGVLADDLGAGPFLEPHTVKWLDELQRLADSGDADALAKVSDAGDVYIRRSA